MKETYKLILIIFLYFMINIIKSQIKLKFLKIKLNNFLL